jgi:thiol-disulfide isomerase/thioredoxin
MRKFNSLVLLSALSTALILNSCSKGGSSGGGTTPPPPPPANTLKVTLDKTQIFADNWETVTVTVTDQNNNDVTSSSQLYLGNVLMSGNSFWTNAGGTYQVKATRSGVSSPEVTLTAVNPGPSPFTQKIVVEDYTGTWCGHCPRVGIKLEDYVNNGHPNCIVIANHGPSNDPYTFSNHASLANSFSVTGYPSAVVDRDFKWSENNVQLDQQFTNRRAPVGLAFQTSISGNTINVTAKVKFDVTTAVNLKLVAYLLEDGKVYPQVNYNYFGLPNPIPGYVHNAILRRTGTDLFGDNIPTASQTKGTTFEKTLAFDATGLDINNCRIVAFVVQGSNSQGRKEKAILNAQVVKAGLNKNFD